MGGVVPRKPHDAGVSQRTEKVPEQQRERLADMVAFARAESPYYRELYQRLPERVEDPTLLPVTDKKKLMARFDEWVTDREVTLEKVRAFIGDKDRIGEKFLGKYLIAATAGTTGTPGIFVLDDYQVKVGKAASGQAFRQWLSYRDFLRMLFRGMRMAVVHAKGHYMSNVTVNLMRRSSRLAARITRDYSVHAPIPELVRELNGFRPVLLGSYASVASLLTAEQEEGRLRIEPVLIIVTAEGLAEQEYGRIAKAFGAKVGNVWGSTEISGVAYSCDQGWLHVMDEWVVVEPVDAKYRPSPPGEPSHTVLVSNLANRVQPILRYDLGDSVLVRPDSCPCGNKRTAIKVQGRSSQILELSKDGGEKVRIPPLALELSDIPGVELSQVVQTSPTALKVRLRLSSNADAEGAWKTATTELETVLRDRGLGHVRVERTEEEPKQNPGGKIPTVIPLGREAR